MIFYPKKIIILLLFLILSFLNYPQKKKFSKQKKSTSKKKTSYIYQKINRFSKRKNLFTLARNKFLNLYEKNEFSRQIVLIITGKNHFSNKELLIFV